MGLAETPRLPSLADNMRGRIMNVWWHNWFMVHQSFYVWYSDANSGSSLRYFVHQLAQARMRSHPLPQLNMYLQQRTWSLRDRNCPRPHPQMCLYACCPILRTKANLHLHPPGVCALERGIGPVWKFFFLYYILFSTSINSKQRMCTDANVLRL